MDARSIAATALSGGFLASAENSGWTEKISPYHFGAAPYLSKVYNGVGKAEKDAALRYGPNIVDWPEMDELGANLLLKVAAYITDPVTTTDELIPSGETSSFRSNPLGLAEFTLSRKDPAYVGRAKAVQKAAKAGASGAKEFLPEFADILELLKKVPDFRSERDLKNTQLGSAIFAHKPGDGSAREQAASCQRVLGGSANFAHEYATKRYRSNLVNWGILPFIIEGEVFKNGDYIFIPNIADKIRASFPILEAWILSGKGVKPLILKTPELNQVEREIILDGSLINYNRKNIQTKRNGRAGQ
jgi:aconitate hydratase